MLPASTAEFVDVLLVILGKISRIETTSIQNKIEPIHKRSASPWYGAEIEISTNTARADEIGSIAMLKWL